MSRQRKKRRSRSKLPFVMLHWHLLDSQGWHELSPHARLAYVELCRQYNGKNNGLISMSARRLAHQLPCDKSTASRALRELDDAGFVQTMSIGTFKRKDRRASEYRLCIHPCDVTNELPVRNWNCDRWAPSNGTGESYRTGAQIKHRKTETPSTVRPKRTCSPAIDVSTVRANHTHLDSAMRGDTNENTGEPVEGTRNGSPVSDEGFPELPDFLRRVRA